MADPVNLHGYRYSVYTRIARLTLLAKAVGHEVIEVDPFAPLPQAYRALHPFGRVPALVHGSFAIFETSAITRYIDRAFDGPSLQPARTVALARMDQLVAAIDAYAYWPMVRQVASHGFFRARFGEPSSPQEVDAGLRASATMLSFLEDVAAEGEILTGVDITLADCHLAPVIDYFVRTEAGKAALFEHPALQAWWNRIATLPALAATDPFRGEATSP